jgi:phosphatidylcholine synthase
MQNTTLKTPLSAILPAAFVHVLTASGILLGLMALIAASRSQFETAFVWLGVALIVDGIDGPLARRFKVKEVLPRFSGERLDLIVDYLTYVIVPAVMIYESPLLPEGFRLAGALLAAFTSLYHFADLNSKCEEDYFVGFPAIWNLVLFYLFAVPCPPYLALVIVTALAGLTFVPFKWLHPVRVKFMRPVTFAVMAAWALSAVAVTAAGFPAVPVLQGVLIVCGIYALSIGIARSTKYFSRTQTDAAR